MRKFLNWLFNSRNAGISSALIVGFVAGMGGMSFYIGTMIDTGSLADWFSALGTIVAAAIALYLGLRPVSRNYKIELYRGNMQLQHKETGNIRINFAIYNGGNKPFILYKAYLEGDKGKTVKLDFDNDNENSPKNYMPYLLGENDITFLYLKGNEEIWSEKNPPENPYIVLQEVNGDKVRKRLEDFKVKH